MKTGTWNHAKKVAKADAELRQIARIWVEANQARNHDPMAVRAYKYRCEELGVKVPNSVYWGFLMIISAS